MICALLQPCVAACVKRALVDFLSYCVESIAITLIATCNRCHGPLIALKVNWVRVVSVRRACVNVYQCQIKPILFAFYDWEMKSIH